MDTGSNDRYLIEVAHQVLGLAYEPSYLGEQNVGSSGLPPEGTDHPVENTSPIRDASSNYVVQKDYSESFSWNRFPNRDDYRLQTSFEEATPEEIGHGSVVQKIDVFTETGWVSFSDLGNGLSYSDDDETSKDDGSIERDDNPYENSRFTSVHSKTKDSDGMPDLIRAKDAPVNNGNHEKPPDLTPEVQRNPHIPEVQRNSHIPEVQRNSHIPEPSKTPQIAVVQPFKINETSKSQNSSPSSKKTEGKESLDPHLKHILRSKQRLDLSQRVNVCYPSKPRKKSQKPPQNYTVSPKNYPKKDSTPSKVVISQTILEEKERKDACVRSPTPKNVPEGRLPEKPVNVKNTAPLEPFFEEDSYLPFMPQPSPAHYYDEDDLVAILTKPKSPIERDDLDNGRSEYNNQWSRDDSFGDFESPLSNDLSTSSGAELSTPPGGLENPLLLHNPSPSPSLPSQSPTSLVPFDSNTVQTNCNLNPSSLDFTCKITPVVSNKVSESPEVSFLLSDSNQQENKPSAKSKKSIDTIVTRLKSRSQAISNCADSSETIENPSLISNENILNNISFATDVSIQSNATTIADPFSVTNRLHLEILPESQTTISNSEIPEYPNKVLESRENFSFEAQNVKLFKISENADNSDFEKKDSLNFLEEKIKAQEDINISSIMPKTEVDQCIEASNLKTSCNNLDEVPHILKSTMVGSTSNPQSMKRCEQMVETKIDKRSDFVKIASGASGSGHFDSIQNTADLKDIFKVVEGHNLGDSFKDNGSAPNSVSATDYSNLNSYETSGKENSDVKAPLNPPKCVKEVEDHKDTEKKIEFTNAKDACKPHEIRNGVPPLNSVVTSEMILDKDSQARDSVADTNSDLNSACESHTSPNPPGDSLQQSIPHQESPKDPLITPKYDKSINAQETKDFQNKVAKKSNSNHVRDAPERSYVDPGKISKVIEDTCNKDSVKDFRIKSNEKPQEVPLKLDKSVPNSISDTNLSNSARQKNPHKKTEEIPHSSKHSGSISVIDLTKGDDHENLNSSKISENIISTYSNGPSEPNSVVSSQRKKYRKEANISRDSQLSNMADTVKDISLSNCTKSASTSSQNNRSKPSDTESSNIIVDHEKMRKIADKIASNARNATKAFKVDEETKLTESAVIGQKPKELDIVVTSDKEIPRLIIKNISQLLKSANGSSTLDVSDSLNENNSVASVSSVRKNSRLKTSEVAKNKVPSKEVKSSETTNFVETIPRRSTRKNSKISNDNSTAFDSENKLINKLGASDDKATSSKSKNTSELTDRTANPHCSFEAPLPRISKATKGGSSLSQRKLMKVSSNSSNKTILSNTIVSEVPLEPDKFAKEAEGQAALPTERENGLKITRERKNARMSPWCKPKKDLTLNDVEEKGSEADPLRRMNKAEVKEENKNDVFGPNGSSYIPKTDSKPFKKLLDGTRVSTNYNGPSVLVRLDLTKIHPLVSDDCKTLKVLSVNNKKKDSTLVRRSGSSIRVEKNTLALKKKVMSKIKLSSKEPQSYIVDNITSDDNKPELSSPVQPFSVVGKIVIKKSSSSITENKKSTSNQLLKNKRSAVSNIITKKQPVGNKKHDQSESKVSSYNGESVLSLPAKVLEPCDQSSSITTFIKTNSSDDLYYKPFNVPPKKRPVNIRKQSNVDKFETPISSLTSVVESKSPASTSFSNSDKKETIKKSTSSTDDVENGKILESEVSRTYHQNVDAFATKTSPHIVAPLEKIPEKSLVPNDNQGTGIYLTVTSCEDSRTKSSEDLKNFKSLGQMSCDQVSRNSPSSTVPCDKNEKSPLLNNKSLDMKSLISPETPASSKNNCVTLEEEIVHDDTKTETLSVNMETSLVPVVEKNDDITCNIQTVKYLSSPVKTSTKSKVNDSADVLMGDSSYENKEIAEVQIFTVPENSVSHNISLIPDDNFFIGNDKNKEISLIDVCEKMDVESPLTCTKVKETTSNFRGNVFENSHSLANIAPFNEKNEKISSVVTEDVVTSVCAERDVEFPHMCADDKKHSESKCHDKNEVIENSVTSACGERVVKLLQACPFDKGSAIDDKDDSQSLDTIGHEETASGVTQDKEKETSSAGDKGITDDKENSHSLKTIDKYVQLHDRIDENSSTDVIDPFIFISEKSDAKLSKTCTENEVQVSSSNTLENSLEYPQSLTTIDSTVLLHDKNEKSPSSVVMEDSVQPFSEKMYVELSKTCTEKGGAVPTVAANSLEYPQSLTTIDSNVLLHDKNEESPSIGAIEDSVPPVCEKSDVESSKTCTEIRGTSSNISENPLEYPQSLITIDSTVLLHDKNEECSSIVTEYSVPPVCEKSDVESSKTCTEIGGTSSNISENFLIYPQSLTTLNSTVLLHDKNEESPSIVIEDSVTPVCEKRYIELSKSCTENEGRTSNISENSLEYPQSLTTIDSTVLLHDKNEESPSIVIEDSVPPACEKRYVESSKTCTEIGGTSDVAENSLKYPQSLTTLDRTVLFHDKNEENPSIVIEDPVPPACEKSYVEFSQTGIEIEERNSKLLTPSDYSVGFHRGKEEGPSIYFIEGSVLSTTEPRDDELPQTCSEDVSNKEISPDVTEGKETTADITGDKETSGDVIEAKDKVSYGTGERVPAYRVTEEKETPSSITKDNETVSNDTQDKETSSDYTEDTETSSCITLDKETSSCITSVKETLSRVTENTQTACDIIEAEETAFNVTEDREKAANVTESNEKSSYVLEDRETVCSATGDEEPAVNVTEDKGPASGYPEGKERAFDDTQDRETSSDITDDRTTATDFREAKEIASGFTGERCAVANITEDRKTVSDVTEDKENACDVTEDRQTLSELNEDNRKPSDVTDDKKKLSDVTEDNNKLSDVPLGKETVFEVTEYTETACDATEDKEKVSRVTEDTETVCSATGDEESAVDVTEAKDTASGVPEDKERAFDDPEVGETSSDITEDRTVATDFSEAKEIATGFTGERCAIADITEDIKIVSDVTDDKGNACDVTEDRQTVSEVTEDNRKPSDVSDDSKKLSDVTLGKETVFGITEVTETACDVTEDKEKVSGGSKDTETVCSATGDEESAVGVTEDKDTASGVPEDKERAFDDTQDRETSYDITEVRMATTDFNEAKEVASSFTGDRCAAADITKDIKIVSDVTDDKENACDVTEGRQTVSEATEDKRKPSDVTEDKKKPSDVTEDKRNLSDVTLGKEAVLGVTEDTETACDVTDDEIACNVTKDRETPFNFTEDRGTASELTEDKESAADVSEDTENVCDVSEDRETTSYRNEDRKTATDFSADKEISAGVTEDKKTAYDVTENKDTVYDVTDSGTSPNVTEDKDTASGVPVDKETASVATEGKEKATNVATDKEAIPNVTEGKADVTGEIETVSGVNEDRITASDATLDKETESGDNEAASDSPSFGIIGKIGRLTECKDVEPVEELYDADSKDKTPSVLQTTSEMANSTVDVKSSNTKTSSDKDSLVIEGGDMYSNLNCKKMQNAGIPNDPEAFDATPQKDLSEIKNLPETPSSSVPLVILHSKSNSPTTALDDCDRISTLVVEQNQQSDNSEPNTSENSALALDRTSTCPVQPKVHPLRDVNRQSSRKRLLLDTISEGPNVSKFARLSVEIVASLQSEDNTMQPSKNIGCAKKRHATSNLETSPPLKTLKSNPCSTSDSFVMPIVRIENLDTKQRIMEILMSHGLTMSPYVLKELFPEDEYSDDSYSSDNESEKYSPWSYNGFRCLARKLRRTETTKTPALPHIKSKEALPPLSETALSETSIFPQVHSDTPVVPQVRPETAAVPQQLSKTEPSGARVGPQFTSSMLTQSHLLETGPSKVPLSSRVRSKTAVVPRVCRKPQPLSKTEPHETLVPRFSSEMVTDLLEAEPTKAPLVSQVSPGTKVSSQNISILTESHLPKTATTKVSLSSRVRSKTTVVSRASRETGALPQQLSKTQPPEIPVPRFSSEMVTDRLEVEPTEAPLVSQVSSGSKVSSQNSLSYCQKTYMKKQLRKSYAQSDEECSPNKSRKVYEISGVSSLDKTLYNLLYSSLESHRESPPQASYYRNKYRHSMKDDDGFLGFLPCLKHGVSLGEKPSCDCSASRIPIPCRTSPPTSLPPLPSQNPSTKASPPKHSPASNHISSERHSNNAKFPSCKVSSPQCPTSNLAKPTKNDKEVRTPRPAVRLCHDEWGRCVTGCCQRPKKVLPWDTEMTSYGMALPDDQPPSLPNSTPSQTDEPLFKER